jgi:hypothetical protein
MLYGREESSRQILVNASGFKTLFEKDYGVQYVDYIDGPRWASILRNHTAQARLYNPHRNIVSLHGAHSANLFFAHSVPKSLKFSVGSHRPVIDSFHNNGIRDGRSYWELRIMYIPKRWGVKQN